MSKKYVISTDSTETAYILYTLLLDRIAYLERFNKNIADQGVMGKSKSVDEMVKRYKKELHKLHILRRNLYQQIIEHKAEEKAEKAAKEND